MWISYYFSLWYNLKLEQKGIMFKLFPFGSMINMGKNLLFTGPKI